MRLIDADLLRKELEADSNLYKDSLFDMYDRGAYRACQNAIELLDEQPTVVKGVRIYPGTIVVTTETEVLEETGRVVLEDDGIWCKTFYADEQPTVQPERKRGKWIPVDSYSACGGDEATWMAHGNPVAFYYCSECKEQAYAGEDGESLITDFCPHCGADMRPREEV